MQRQYKSQNRKLQRRHKHHDEAQVNPQSPIADSPDNILHLQKTLGNQAVMQMMRGGETKQTQSESPSYLKGFKMQAMPQVDDVPQKAAQPPIKIGQHTIQRMPQVDVADGILPHSDAENMARRRAMVLNMIRKVHQKVEEYPQGFPQSPDDVRNGMADVYFQEQVADLKVLTDGIWGSLHNMKDYFTERANKKKIGSSKHKKRIEKVRQLMRMTEKSNRIHQVLFDVHHASLNAVMSGAGDL